jgi:hypothetical protein
MANKSGTNVASAVTTFTDSDTYATAYANEIQGGRHSVTTLDERNKIYKSRRKVGMTCYVSDTNKTYKLINEPGTTETTETDWKVDIPSEGDIVDTNGVSLTTKLTNLETATGLKYVMFEIDPVTTGVSDVEHKLLFNGNITTVTLSIPVSVALTQNLTVNLELYSGGSWSTVSSLTIATTNTDKTITNTLETAKAVTLGQRLRANVILAQSNIQSLELAVGLQLTE